MYIQSSKDKLNFIEGGVLSTPKLNADPSLLPREHGGKTSFLVFKHHKYFTVPTRNIAFFYLKYDSANIVCFDRQEYAITRSLENIQNLVAAEMFFRLNRQYLISFYAIKEVEHYFARKLLVNLNIPTTEKLLIPKDKVTHFLEWMENR